jgi:hypothetical protein
MQAHTHATVHSRAGRAVLHQQHTALRRFGGCTKHQRLALACAALRSLQDCQQNDVLEVTFNSSSSSSSSVEYLQVMQGWDGSSAVLLRKGQLLRLAAAAGEGSGALQLTALGETD